MCTRIRAYPTFLPIGSPPHSPPDRTFYEWADVSKVGVPSMDFVRYLIEREHVAVAPGSAFGKLGEGFLRLSLAF